MSACCVHGGGRRGGVRQAAILVILCFEPCPRTTHISVSSPSIVGSFIYLLFSTLHILTASSLSRGLKYVSKHRKQRVAAIASALAASDYDVIALQELWVFADYEHVRSSVSSRLPYSKFFYR